MSELRAGAARSCITPWLRPGFANWRDPGDRRERQHIADDLYAKAIVLENEDTSMAIVVCDLGMLLQEDCDRAKDLASRMTGIPPENIFVSCTHIHSGPATASGLGDRRDEYYMATAMERVATSVLMAQNEMRPAEAGVARTAVPGETFNRRIRMRDGSIRNNFALRYQDPDAVEPAGPTDPEVVVLAVRDLERQPIAILASYSLHYMGALGDPGPAYSADYFGEFDHALQRIAGGRFVGVMANGCCGDVNQIDIWHPKAELPYFRYHVERVANVLAGAAYGAWQGLRGFQYDRSPTLGAATEMAALGRRQPTEAQLQRAQALLAGEAPLDGEPRLRPWEFKQWEMVYAEEILLVDEEPLKQQHPIMALRVGELGIVGLPGEAFVEYGLDIKARSPFETTMIIELANGYAGYLATDKALTEVDADHNSYDTHLARSSKASVGTQGSFVNAALAALGRLR